MSRVQLAINVENLDEAIDFYSRIFDAVPVKVRPGYANFAIADPPLKLVLFENQGKGGSINHLGVEVQTTEDNQRRRCDAFALLEIPFEGWEYLQYA